MKRIAILTLVLCLLFVGAAWAVTGAMSSGEQTADALIHTGRCYITKILIVTDGTNDAKVVIYDNTVASGTVRGEFTVTGSSHYGGCVNITPTAHDKGIYVDVTGTGASYFIEYLTE